MRERYRGSTRACLKNHFRNLQAPLCGIFYPHSVAIARYAALIRIKSPTNLDSQLTKSLFRHALKIYGGKKPMIRRYVYGNVIETEAVLNKPEQENGALPYFTVDE